MKNLKFLNASNYCITEDGKLYSLKVNSFMKGWLGQDYWINSVTDDNGKSKQVPTHKLVAEAFCNNDDPKNKTVVNHKDGNKLNNHKDNLEWVTPSENNKHAYETGLSVGKKPHKDGIETLKGDYNESTNTSSLSEEDAHTICQLIAEGYRDVDISRMTNLPRRSINYLRHKDERYFPFVTEQYDYSFSKEDRMSPEIVIKICEKLSSGDRVMEICRDMNLNRKKVGNIRSRKTFKDISKFYKW